MKAQLLWHDYKYLPYERNLARREAEALIGTQLEEEHTGFTASLPEKHAKQVARLTYFKGVQTNSSLVIPDQARLEASANQSTQISEEDETIMPALRRQSTRYSAHGLHEYRGKFNPQVVRAIGNMLGLNEGAWILDPFCGSGTSLLEAAHIGWNAIGFDVNPLGAMIANAKVTVFKVSLKVLSMETDTLISRLQKVPLHIGRNWATELPNAEYLSKWFTAPVLSQLAAILQEIDNTTAKELRSVFRVVVSDICRKVSLQDPTDLRIRRRKGPLPDFDALSSFTETLRDKIDAILRAREQIKLKPSQQLALFADCRSGNKCAEEFLLENRRRTVDAAITSPPYATALPYVDTQRLSLCLLGLIDAAEIRNVEKTLIGNREISDVERLKLETSLLANEGRLPHEVFCFCNMLLDVADDHEHGFRKRNVPGLVYKYFWQMAETFEAVKKLVKRGGKYALLVGSNRTNLKGKDIYIDTPHLLSLVAASRGWCVEETLNFETYQRFDMHQKNSIRHEVLLVLRNGTTG